MGVCALDHIVLNVADTERALAFYTGQLGLSAERVEAWRSGKAPFPSLRISESTIIDLVAGPNEAAGTRNNLAHFCLVTDSADLAAATQQLAAAGVPIEEGPAVRFGARGNALSIYFRDPDDNLIELRTYAGAGG
jgi:catechol 2,3-dioxygenase-like lactoylglutathione lyase family enzyme